MRRVFLVAVLIASASLRLHAQTPTAPPKPSVTAVPAGPDPATFYAIGVSVARSLASLDLSPSEAASVMKGISDGFDGKAKGVDLEATRTQVTALARARASRRLEKEKARGKEFCAEAAKAPDAVVWPSGLIFTQIKEGSGDSPGASDTVKVRYRGTLIDGTEFDSSARGHDPATFGVNNVIRCWTEGLQKMKVGGKAKLVCPADIAYGDRGAPPAIPPGATLVFDVELVDVAKATPSTALTPSPKP
jgi:FKBP-type peptidyl-prolyl cis-trans isomerase FkpA